MPVGPLLFSFLILSLLQPSFKQEVVLVFIQQEPAQQKNIHLIAFKAMVMIL